jgi:trk system potassium uptake protein TrkA
MRIVIAGAGEVGFHIAKLLSNEAHSIVLIDTNQDVLNRAEDEMDVYTIKGLAYSFKVMERAQVNDADLLIAVTSSETTNLTIATIGKQLGAKRTIARINNIEFLKLKHKLNFDEIGIDVMISPEDLAAKEINRLIRQSAFTDSFDFGRGLLHLVGVHFEENAVAIGMSIQAVSEMEGVRCLAVMRSNEKIIPCDSDYFKDHDHAYFLCKQEGLDTIARLAGKEFYEINDIMILGGGRVAGAALKRLKHKKNIKVIEKEEERSFELADAYPDILVINDDGHNVKLLEEENISEMDAFIAVTGNSETNIISCLLAKSHGVKKTIALVENMDYISLSQNIGIDTLINKKLIAANNIFRYVRKGEIINIAGLHGLDVEVLEIEVLTTSLLAKKPLNKINLPDGVVLGGWIRDDEAHLINGDEQLQVGDRVIVLSIQESIKKTIKLFR